MPTQKTRREECEGDRETEGERPRALWFLFVYVSFLPLGLPYVNWATWSVVCSS